MSEGEVQDKEGAQEGSGLEAHFDDLLAALDEELAPEDSSSSLVNSLSSSFLYQDKEKQDEKAAEDDAPGTPVTNVFHNLISETVRYGQTPKGGSSDAAHTDDSTTSDANEEESDESSAQFDGESSQNGGVFVAPHEWEARRQPLKPIVLSSSSRSPSTSPSPIPQTSFSKKDSRRHRLSTFFKHGRSSSDSDGTPAGESMAVRNNTVNLSQTGGLTQSTPSIKLGTARQRAISDTPSGRRRPPLSSVVVRPVQTELEPWMAENGVNPEVAAILKEHNFTLAQIRTLTDAELRGLGVESLIRRLEFYYCCYAGRRSVMMATRDIRTFAKSKDVTDTPEEKTEEVEEEEEEEEGEEKEGGGEEEKIGEGAEEGKTKKKKHVSKQEKAVICCQNLIRSSLMTNFLSDNDCARYSIVQKLISTLKDAEKCFGRLYSFFTEMYVVTSTAEGTAPSPHSVHGLDDGASRFEAFVILLQVWNQTQKVLNRMLRRWSRLSCPGLVLLSDVSLEWWYSAFLLYFSRRGQFALRLESFSNKNNKKVFAIWEKSVASLVSAGYDQPKALLYSASKKYLGAMLVCLEELLKETKPVHEDHPQLSLVVSRTKTLLEADQRTADNDTASLKKYQTLVELAKNISDAPKEVVAWSRELLFTGKVIVLRPEVPESKRKHRSNQEMLLFNDMLLLGKKSKASSNIHFKAMYNLKDVQSVCDIPDGSSLGAKVIASRVWSLMMPAPVPPVYFQAVSDKEKTEFIQRVKKACDDAKEHIKRSDSEQVAIRNGLATETTK